MGDFLGGLFGTPKAPAAPTPGEIPASPSDPNADTLAQARKLAEIARVGRSSLVKDPGVFAPAGSSGISNPRLPVL